MERNGSSRSHPDKNNDTWIQCCKSLLNINSRSECKFDAVDHIKAQKSMFHVAHLQARSFWASGHVFYTFRMHILPHAPCLCLVFRRSMHSTMAYLTSKLENCLNPCAISILVTQDGRALMKEEMPVHCMVKESVPSLLNTVCAI